MPLQSNLKVIKLLKNLVALGASTIESAQIETFVQNSDSFIEILTITIKYIKASLKVDSKNVPYDLIEQLLDLTSKIAMKIKEIKLELPIS